MLNVIYLLGCVSLALVTAILAPQFSRRVANIAFFVMVACSMAPAFVAMNAWIYRFFKRFFEELFPGSLFPDGSAVAPLMAAVALAIAYAIFCALMVAFYDDEKEKL